MIVGKGEGYKKVEVKEGLEYGGGVRVSGVEGVRVGG